MDFNFKIRHFLGFFGYIALNLAQNLRFKIEGFPGTVLDGLTERGRKMVKRVGEIEGILRTRG